ncbi:hypothetical protein GGI21_000501 [Coemansia aciculifera]|nr:hypothetical protein GGI21_000501 [Coemansia aciculifera]
MKLLKLLLWTCHNFRAITLPLYCSCFSIFSDVPADIDIKQDYARYSYLGHQTHHLTKYLEIKVDGSSIYSGEALKQFTNARYKGRAFPLVKVLTVTIDMTNRREDSEIDTFEIDGNISTFACRIKEAVPLLADVRLRYIPTIDLSDAVMV